VQVLSLAFVLLTCSGHASATTWNR